MGVRVRRVPSRAPDVQRDPGLAVRRVHGHVSVEVHVHVEILAARIRAVARRQRTDGYRPDLGSSGCAPVYLSRRVRGQRVVHQACGDVGIGNGLNRRSGRQRQRVRGHADTIRVLILGLHHVIEHWPPRGGADGRQLPCPRSHLQRHLRIARHRDPRVENRPNPYPLASRVGVAARRPVPPRDAGSRHRGYVAVDLVVVVRRNAAVVETGIGDVVRRGFQRAPVQVQRSLGHAHAVRVLDPSRHSVGKLYRAVLLPKVPPRNHLHRVRSDHQGHARSPRHRKLLVEACPDPHYLLELVDSSRGQRAAGRVHQLHGHDPRPSVHLAGGRCRESAVSQADRRRAVGGSLDRASVQRERVGRDAGAVRVQIRRLHLVREVQHGGRAGRCGHDRLPPPRPDRQLQLGLSARRVHDHAPVEGDLDEDVPAVAIGAALGRRAGERDALDLRRSDLAAVHLARPPGVHGGVRKIGGAGGGVRSHDPPAVQRQRVGGDADAVRVRVGLLHDVRKAQRLLAVGRINRLAHRRSDRQRHLRLSVRRVHGDLRVEPGFHHNRVAPPVRAVVRFRTAKGDAVDSRRPPAPTVDLAGRIGGDRTVGQSRSRCAVGGRLDRPAVQAQGVGRDAHAPRRSVVSLDCVREIQPPVRAGRIRQGRMAHLRPDRQRQARLSARRAHHHRTVEGDPRHHLFAVSVRVAGGWRAVERHVADPRRSGLGTVHLARRAPRHCAVGGVRVQCRVVLRLDLGAVQLQRVRGDAHPVGVAVGRLHRVREVQPVELGGDEEGPADLRPDHQVHIGLPVRRGDRYVPGERDAHADGFAPEVRAVARLQTQEDDAFHGRRRRLRFDRGAWKVGREAGRRGSEENSFRGRKTANGVGNHD